MDVEPINGVYPVLGTKNGTLYMLVASIKTAGTLTMMDQMAYKGKPKELYRGIAGNPRCASNKIRKYKGAVT
ncbi:hypothetical protein LX64_04874 [Chitinophaga skermanii]|uniref:Uncharacterized protein n=1 Tax=Chitinophaga skermanii TaxID=331697 RepID=A0A327Q5M1_9BACT|nr:hypothetical protein [Chitinophaga skermanii]RAI98512.1 hypothetical protein LX64_04874 [Chitinophaga skermanii]